ncbi:HTH domain-containing protein [Clostridium tetanomorphum]|uniref:HTH domain-containing protein n=1 Tax=Clostridium tetanomorphum TaxID=1553 RepID=A0A923EDR6_CLOTT|nr:HTH domain-containing protein [Clostridium tetanomorphum]MBC2398825.1 HTH domain-containing protein [Clostridium tetanomorphum]NRZ96807.1 putative DNA-binding transcriptional regulator YafY [Clostridium tetanomorphum]
MTKLSIQFRLLYILIDENIHSAKDLERELELKNSTLRWYINSLILSGFQVESLRGRGGGYRLDKKMRINNIWKLIKNDK